MIVVFADQKNGILKKASKEAISQGKKLASEKSSSLAVVLTGASCSNLADEVKKFGADKIYLAESAENYSPDGYAEILSNAVKNFGGKYVLAPATAMCVDFIPRAAAKLEAGLVSDITALDFDGDNLVTTKPFYAGKAIAKIKLNSDIQMVTLRPNVFDMAENAGAGEVVNVDAPAEQKAVAVKTELKEAGKVELTEAEIICSGGRGLKEGANFSLIEELCEPLNAALGASRAAVDAGWIDHSHQVGQTGKVVSPKVYIASGISGAIQHIAGMGTSQYIIAINKDADAPIFNIADLGVVGDLFKVVPALVEELKK